MSVSSQMVLRTLPAIESICRSAIRTILCNRLEVSAIIFTKRMYKDMFLSIGFHSGPNGPDDQSRVVCHDSKQPHHHPPSCRRVGRYQGIPPLTHRRSRLLRSDRSDLNSFNSCIRSRSSRTPRPGMRTQGSPGSPGFGYRVHGRHRVSVKERLYLGLTDCCAMDSRPCTGHRRA